MLFKRDSLGDLKVFRSFRLPCFCDPRRRHKPQKGPIFRIGLPKFPKAPFRSKKWAPEGSFRVLEGAQRAKVSGPPCTSKSLWQSGAYTATTKTDPKRTAAHLSSDLPRSFYLEETIRNHQSGEPTFATITNITGQLQVWHVPRSRFLQRHNTGRCVRAQSGFNNLFKISPASAEVSRFTLTETSCQPGLWVAKPVTLAEGNTQFKTISKRVLSKSVQTFDTTSKG